jgi:hypothetical protein
MGWLASGEVGGEIPRLANPVGAARPVGRSVLDADLIRDVARAERLHLPRAVLPAPAPVGRAMSDAAGRPIRCWKLGCWLSGLAIDLTPEERIYRRCPDHPTPEEAAQAEAHRRAADPHMTAMREWAERRGLR